MSIQTTTLPAARPGAQPIRRRAIVPAPAVAPAAPSEEDANLAADKGGEGAGGEYAGEEGANEEGGGSDAGGDEGGAGDETQANAGAADAQAPAAPVVAARRGRGRPRKAPVATIEGGSEQVAQALTAEMLDLAAVGSAAVAAAKLGVTLDAYIESIRGILTAYDRVVRNKPR